MNLIEINNYKKKLKFQRYLCFAMAFLTLTSATREFKKNINSGETKSDIGYEFVSVHATNSRNNGVIGKEVIDAQKNIVAYVPDTSKEELIKPKAQIETEVEEPRELTCEEKMMVIMERDGYTYDELNTSCATCVAESYGDGNCYNEGYDIASVIDNRTHNELYVSDVNKVFGENAGYSIYYQVICPGQFTAYGMGYYKEFLGRTDLLAYQAAVDMFYSGVPSNNYLNFRSEPKGNSTYEQLNPPYGNYFHRTQKSENLIDDELVRELVLKLHN